MIIDTQLANKTGIEDEESQAGVPRIGAKSVSSEERDESRLEDETVKLPHFGGEKMSSREQNLDLVPAVDVNSSTRRIAVGSLNKISQETEQNRLAASTELNSKLHDKKLI